VSQKVESLQKVLPRYDIVVIAISSPILVGLYLEDKLIERISREGMCSEVLLPVLKDLINQYEINSIIYARGPGSYMAIKIAYITLKTIEITRGIRLKGCNAFLFNDNNPIKAMGNLYFVKEKETIITIKLDEVKNRNFTLPQSIEKLNIDDDTTPLYLLPAV
jgi:tRNA A37 threonylcarbamoyladenosine modification protein TsaB